MSHYQVMIKNTNGRYVRLLFDFPTEAEARAFLAGYETGTLAHGRFTRAGTDRLQTLDGRTFALEVVALEGEE